MSKHDITCKFSVFFQEIESSTEVQMSPTKITGTTDTQFTACIGEKRLFLFCSDEMKQDIVKIIPKRVKITYTDIRLMSYERHGSQISSSCEHHTLICNKTILILLICKYSKCLNISFHYSELCFWVFVLKVATQSFCVCT